MQHKVTLCLLLMTTGDQQLPGGAVTIYRAAHCRGTLTKGPKERDTAHWRSRSAQLGIEALDSRNLISDTMAVANSRVNCKTEDQL